MVRILMMQTMTVDLADRIHINREGVAHHNDELYEPLIVVERTVSDSQMQDVGQVQAAEKPAKDKIGSAQEQSLPRSQLSRRGEHTGQRVAQNNQISIDVVDFHGTPRATIQAEIKSSFKQQVAA